MAQLRHHGRERLSDWDRPPYREIEMKIGEGLRERYKPPQELSWHMLTLLMQFGGEDAIERLTESSQGRTNQRRRSPQSRPRQLRRR